MKLLIFVFAALSLACNGQADRKATPVDSITITASAHIVNPDIDSILAVRDAQLAKASKLVDSLRLKLRQAKDTIFLYKFTVQRAKYRVRIVTANKSQLVFLVGWLNRIFDGL